MRVVIVCPILVVRGKSKITRRGLRWVESSSIPLMGVLLMSRHVYKSNTRVNLTLVGNSNVRSKLPRPIQTVHDRSVPWNAQHITTLVKKHGDADE